MTIYECLGIDHILLDQEIPKDRIIKNIEKEDLRHDAEFCFRVIDQVSLRASIQRGEDHFLQVLEITLNSPDFIREISFLIQKAIKYRVLFIFVFEGRYLIVRRSFNLTMSTENVHSDSAPFCSDWIYEEYLHLDILYSHRFCAVEEYAEADEEAVRLLKTDADNGDYILFKDLLSSAERLNKCIVESECISTRWFIDWLKIHVAGQRVEIGDFIERIVEREAYQFIGDYLFIDKTCARYAMTALDNTFYKLPSLSMDHTGKWPMRYFEGISSPSTYEEADILSHAIQYGADDIIFLELQSHKADERRRLDDEHKRFLEERRREAEHRKAAEEQRKLDEWRKEWEQRRLELLQPVDEPEESDEDDLDEEELEFDDISFAIYDKDNLHIEFCNFEIDDDAVYMTFWANNTSGRDIKLWAMEINVDGEEVCGLANIGVVRASQSEWCKLKLDDVAPEGCYSVDCFIEIDNLENCELDRTERVSVEVDFDDYTQSAELLDDLDEDEELEFEDIEFPVFDNDDDIYVEFCNFEVEDDEVFFNFWIRNYAEQTINVYAQDIYVNGIKISDYMLVGEFEPDECDYGRFSLPQISPTSSYLIRAYVEIDDEDNDLLDRGEVFEISVDFEAATLAARSCAEEEAEKRRLEEERRAEEQRRLAEELRRAEEQRRLEEERRKAEEQRRLEEERRKAEEQLRREEERRKAEEQRRREEERRKAEEQRRLEEELRRAEEQRRLEEERRRAEEQRRLEEERRKAEEQRRLEEERKKEEALQLERERKRAEIIRQEQLRLREEARRKELERQEAEKQRIEEERKDSIYQSAEELFMSNEIESINQAVQMFESISGWKDSNRRIRQAKEIKNMLLKKQEESKRALYRSKKVCQHCGGSFKGLFKKVCSNCGRSKDY